MTPYKFPQADTTFGPPEGMSEGQVATIHACVREIKDGGLDGTQAVVVAWMPSSDDLDRLKEGAPVYLMCVGGLVPHSVSTVFPFVDAKG